MYVISPLIRSSLFQLRRQYVTDNKDAKEKFISKWNANQLESTPNQIIISDWEYDYVMFDKIPDFSVSACNFLSQLLTRNPKDVSF